MAQDVREFVGSLADEIAAIEREIETRQERIRELEAARRVILARLGNAAPQSSGGQSAATGPFASSDFPSAAVAVLREADGPLDSGEIADRLLAGGYQTTSKNFRNTARSSLARISKKMPELGIRKDGTRWYLAQE